MASERGHLCPRLQGRRGNWRTGMSALQSALGFGTYGIEKIRDSLSLECLCRPYRPEAVRDSVLLGLWPRLSHPGLTGRNRVRALVSSCDRPRKKRFAWPRHAETKSEPKARHVIARPEGPGRDDPANIKSPARVPRPCPNPSPPDEPTRHFLRSHSCGHPRRMA